MDDRMVYGDEAGRWCILVMAPNLDAPGAVFAFDDAGKEHTLDHLGSPLDVVNHVHDALSRRAANAITGKRRPQITLAQYLGMTQSAISGYVCEGTRPRLTSECWARLVRARFDPDIIEDYKPLQPYKQKARG